MSATLELARDLISRASVTPEDDGCQQLIANRLELIGFTAQHLRFEDVDNLWITRGSGSPCVIYVGHTDVVPTGPVDQWTSDPFKPEVRDGFLYGRGAADMKGSVACMVTALERFIQAHPDHNGTIGMLLTSDEEGPSVNGTRKVMEHLGKNNIKIDLCLVGEPTSENTIADVIKNGRRGSLGARLVVKGIQGHVAYPHLADNPVHRLAPALAELLRENWDQGNEFYPPTTLQVSNIHAGTGADNVIPGQVELLINFRFSTESSEDSLRKRTQAILDKHNLQYEIHWRLSGNPFITPAGKLLDTVVHAVEKITGNKPAISTGGGTSDGRFIAPTGAEVVELGPVNASCHKIDECVNIADLDTLSAIFECILENLQK